MTPHSIHSTNIPKDIYIIGICGTGVGALAGLLKQQGHRVRGSDEQVYPPMSTKLAEWGIPVLDGYATAHLTPRPDLVIVGNVIRAHNPEAVWARKSGIPTLSMPEAIAEFGIADKHSIVVAGTHGKTSTTALLCHGMLKGGLDPSFLVGGVLLGYPESFRTSTAGRYFVIEGDEYDTAYFDKGPKFWHYKPRTAVITSLEFDHADIYSSIDAIEASFAGLIRRVPRDGHLVVWHGAERARRLIERVRQESDAVQRITVYASTPQPDADLTMARCASGPDGLTFEAVYQGRSLGPMRAPLWGDFSAQNVLAAIGVFLGIGMFADAIRDALITYAGVRRRLEVLGDPAGVVVVDDFAHHPTAVQATLSAARTRWPDRRLWAIFEPRSATTRRNVFQEAFVEAFAVADRVIIASHERLQEIPAAQRFDPGKLAADLQARGVQGEFMAEVDAIVQTIAREARPGDVVLICSNGSFGGLHGALVRQLQQRVLSA